PRDLVQGLRQRDLLSPRSRRPEPVSRLHRLRQHRQRESSAGRALPAELPRVLGQRDARRRLPARPCARAVPRRGRGADVSRAGALEHGVLRRARAGEADRGGVGREGALSGRRLSGVQVARMERPIPRYHSALSARRSGADRRRRHADHRQQRSLRRQRPPADEQHQLRHVPRRLHALRPRQLQPQAQRGERRRNRDGSDHNFSWNSGVEGPTDDPGILRLREQRARNFVAVLLLSQGIPMLLAGDERLRTQRGNNNAYCQDNDTSWIDWRSGPAQDAMLRFTREMIALRQRHANLRRTRFIDPNETGPGGIRWYGETLEPPRWQDPDARILCFTLAGLEVGEPALHVMINMTGGERVLPLPEGAWRRVVDTSLPPPEDILPPSEAPLYAEPSYALAGLAIAVF